jgi:hypothetical protein
MAYSGDQVPNKSTKSPRPSLRPTHLLLAAGPPSPPQEQSRDPILPPIQGEKEVVLVWDLWEGKGGQRGTGVSKLVGRAGAKLAVLSLGPIKRPHAPHGAGKCFRRGQWSGSSGRRPT